MENVETYAQRGAMRFSFPSTTKPVSEVIRVEGLKKAYGEHRVFDGIDVGVRRGEKIGIIGVNGAGKTTLLRMMAGELPHDGGTIKLGSGVVLGYYAQHHADTLDAGSTIYEVVQRAAPDASPNRVRSICGAFMFSGDDIDKPVKVLSGGERARVALARLCAAPGNLLLMDEPTNHLDLASSEALAQSLTTFDGTLVFVSHNRSLIRTLATRIWNVADGHVETYPGTLDEYMYSQAQRLAGKELGRRSSGRRTSDLGPRSSARTSPRARIRAPTAPAEDLGPRTEAPRRPTATASAAKPKIASVGRPSSARSRSRSRSSRSASVRSRPSRRCARSSWPIRPSTTTPRAATSC